MGSIVNSQDNLAGTSYWDEDEDSKIPMVAQENVCDEHAEDIGHNAESSQNARWFMKGTRVHVRNYGSGVVRFTGETHFAPGVFIGVELDEALGKHDGFYDGKRYFQARPNSGVFVRQRRLSVIEDMPPNKSQQGYSFALTLNGGLVTINATLKESFLEDPEIVRYSTRLSPDIDPKVSLEELEGRFLAAQASDDKISKLDFLSWMIEKENEQFDPPHKRNTSHRISGSLRKCSTNLNVKILPEVAPKRTPSELVFSGVQQTPSSVRLVQQSPVAIGQQPTPSSASSPSLICQTRPSRKSPPSSSVLCLPSDMGVVAGPPDNCESDGNVASCPRGNTAGHSVGHLSIDESELDLEEASDSSEDEVGDQVDLLMQEVEHERQIVKRKEERVRELEEELKGYDRELKEKTKTLTKKSKHIEQLEKQCERLSLGIDTAEADAQAWQFEVLYGRGETRMICLNAGNSVGIIPAKNNIV